MLIHGKKIFPLKNYAFGILGLAVLVYPAVSKAGFEWTPPPQLAPAPASPVNPTQESAGPLTPELSTESDSSLPVPVANVEQEPVQPPIESPVVAVPNEQQVTPPAPVVDVKQSSNFPVVEGFGKDIPLAIALRDIAPPNFAYAFNPREIAGTKISWRGGKPWPEVLQAALAQQNLDAVIDGNNMTIFSRQADIAPVTPIVTEQPQPSPTADPVPLVESNPPVVAENTNPVPPVVDMKQNQKWSARPGSTLRQTLESWSKVAGTEINWSTPYDYPIGNAFYFEGSFTNAVDSLLSSFGGENPSPKGRFYPNLPDGPSVLMIN